MPTAPHRSPFNRPRWTEEDAREVIGELQRSGQSVSVFAAERGLDPQRVYLWRRRFGSVVERAPFREVVVRRAHSQPMDGSASPWFEIALGSGHLIRVPASFDADALRRLLEVLATATAC
jgi:transposase-like protein